ncbi:DUF378 domain-containing protein [Candidatus Babeliales bacterium]|nr:DUF378 domain-containing protein [Candidatus Babeliales bacterium]
MMKFLNGIAFFLSAIGAINWGLVAFFKFNLVEYLSGIINMPNLNAIIYAIVALAGVYSLIAIFTSYSCK